MPTGGERFDFTSADGFSRNTNRTLEYTIRDAADVVITDFTGYEVEWFALRSSADADGLTELRDPARFEVTILDGPIDTSGATINVPLTPTDWPARTGAHWHELWRVDSGNVERLSYGEFPVIS